MKKIMCAMLSAALITSAMSVPAFAGVKENTKHMNNADILQPETDTQGVELSDLDEVMPVEDIPTEDKQGEELPDNSAITPTEEVPTEDNQVKEAPDSTDAAPTEGISLFAAASESPFAGGDGTAENPYQVSTPEQLNEVRNYMDKCFIQICDIDMTEVTAEGGIYYNNGKGWTPIGNYYSFKGQYDGSGYAITGLYSQAEYTGLFGNLSKGSVKNVNLTGTIEGGKTSYAGSIVAYLSSGTVTNCSFDGTLSSTNSYAGGIVAYLSSGTVTNCSFRGTLSSTGSHAGGIVAYLSSGTVTNCSFDGTLSTTNSYAGGIVAYNYSSGGTVTNCSSDGTITAGSSAGGIIGQNKGTITNCINNADITSTGTYAGGIIGSHLGSSDITDCCNYGNITGATNAGGIAAYSKANISNCGNIGNIDIITKSKSSVRLGGIVGETNKDISRCFNTGNVTAQSTSSSTGSGSSVGGIVGHASDGIKISDCFNKGKVSSFYTCGDIVGVGYAKQGWSTFAGETTYVKPNSSTLTITNCYNSYSNDTNNFYGYNAAGTSGSQGYQGTSWNYTNIIKVSPKTSYNINADENAKITQLTESEMKQKDKYEGFDFDTVWAIDAAINDGYPYLQNVGNFEPEYIKGDINGDGSIDFIDAQLILKYEAGLIEPSEEERKRADVNGDGIVDFMDAQLILKYEANLITTFGQEA